jgi:GTP cyclohydrolase II
MIPHNINHKQQELIDELFATVQTQYPEITIKGYEVNPDDKEHIWVIVDAPMEEEREIELGRFASGLSTDILMEYGYAISLMTDNPTTTLVHA